MGNEGLESPLLLLNDHAHLEKKAATNALELLNRWPEPNPPENWVAAMTAIVRDEVEHLAIVSRLLARGAGGSPGNIPIPTPANCTNLCAKDRAPRS